MNNNNASTPSRSRRSNNTALESSDYYSSNYGDGSALPPNIDIIAVATLVPNPSDEQETTTHQQLETTDVTVAFDEADTLGLNINEEPPRGGARDGLSVVSEITTPTAIAPPLETLELRNNSTPSSSVIELHTIPINFNNTNTASASVTTANCELAQVNNNATSCNGGESGGGETGSSVNPSTSINTPTPDAQLPVATAEPMGQTSAVIIGDKYIQIKWWHFVIVVLIILVIVLPSTLIPLQRKKGVDLLNTWINTTDNLQETIEQILLENYISNPSTFNNTSSPQYQALNWMANEGGATTIIASNIEQATPYIIQRYILAVLYYITNGPKWRNQYDFLSNVTECEWGVGANNGFNVIDCNNDGFVTLINLWQNNLLGVIPTELVNMTNCTGLDFLTNRLYGSVPVEITQMVQMTYLNLGYNDFTGTVMSEYGNMNRLSKCHHFCMSLYSSSGGGEGIALLLSSSKPFHFYPTTRELTQKISFNSPQQPIL